jgi:hypothetical protein
MTPRCTWAILAITLLATSVSSIAQSQPPADIPAAAPVPAPLMNAKRVFIANAAGDNDPAIAKYTNGADGLYNQFYADIKALGRYELVSSPADADVVMGVVVDYAFFNHEFTYPKFKLEVRDPKTNVLLWTFSEPVEGALLTKTGRKNVAQALSKLTDDLKKLVGNP